MAKLDPTGIVAADRDAERVDLGRVRVRHVRGLVMDRRRQGLHGAKRKLSEVQAALRVRHGDRVRDRLIRVRVRRHGLRLAIPKVPHIVVDGHGFGRIAVDMGRRVVERLAGRIQQVGLREAAVQVQRRSRRRDRRLGVLGGVEVDRGDRNELGELDGDVRQDRQLQQGRGAVLRNGPIRSDDLQPDEVAPAGHVRVGEGVVRGDDITAVPHAHVGRGAGRQIRQGECDRLACSRDGSSGLDGHGTGQP